MRHPAATRTIRSKAAARANRAIGFVLLACLGTGGCSAQEEVLEARIQRIESGLLPGPGIVIEGRPWPEASLSDRMAAYRVPGVSIAVFRDFALEWARGYGVLSEGGAEPVTPATLFQAASISKPVAAAAALSLVQEGLLDLDEDVNGKLESWAVPENEFTAGTKVTLRRILSHTAGVSLAWLARLRGLRAHDHRVAAAVEALRAGAGTFVYSKSRSRIARRWSERKLDGEKDLDAAEAAMRRELGARGGRVSAFVALAREHLTRGAEGDARDALVAALFEAGLGVEDRLEAALPQIASIWASRAR